MQSYFGILWKQAKSDTQKFVSLDFRTFIFLSFSFLAGCSVHYYFYHDLEFIKGEFASTIVFGLAGSLVATAAVLLTQLVCAPYRIWYADQTELVRLHSALSPIVRLIFDPAVDGCVVTTKLIDGRTAKFFRVRVETTGHGSIGPCIGRLVSVIKDGQRTGYAESLQLTWAPAHAPDSLGKFLSDKVPEFLDVCFVRQDGLFSLATPGFISPYSIEGIFEKGHEYSLKIVIAIPGSSSVEIDAAIFLSRSLEESRIIDKLKNEERTKIPSLFQSDTSVTL